jgi:hypothetical protein
VQGRKIALQQIEIERQRKELEALKAKLKK